MGWARLDDRWHDHPKVAEAGLEAAGLWAMCLTWAHSTRRTSKAPGVVPDSVIVRFSGSLADRLTERLHSVGLFDDRTDAGWPIHDFAEYLPKYDTEQAKAAGSMGGKAKAANAAAKPQVKGTARTGRAKGRQSTASKPLSEPLDEPPSGSQANQVAVSSTRASARRNPVPVPVSEEQSSSDGATAPRTAQTLMAEWIDLCGGIQPDTRTSGHVASELKRLLEEGVAYDAVSQGLNLWHSKRLNPAALASVVHGVRIAPTTAPVNGRQAEPEAAFWSSHPHLESKS